jgi:hypothetical protein
MRRRAFSTFLLSISAAGFIAAQTPARPAAPAAPDALYRRATEAWEAGQYPEALVNLTSLMKSAAAPEYLDRVALLTGELYSTTELTADGRNPVIAPSGKYVAYEFGAASDPMTRVVRAADGQFETVFDVKGAGVAFDWAGNQIVWVRPPANAAWTAAGRAIDDAPTTAARTAATAGAAWVLATDGQIVVKNLSSGAERIVPTAGMLKASPARTTRVIGSEVAPNS